MRLGADSQFSDFLDGLGPAQLVGRQTLATPAMGKNSLLAQDFFKCCNNEVRGNILANVVDTLL